MNPLREMFIATTELIHSIQTGAAETLSGVLGVLAFPVVVGAVMGSLYLVVLYIEEERPPGLFGGGKP